MIEADFEVSGRNYWELDREALKVLDSLVGDLIGQRAEYHIRCFPKLSAHGQSEPILWTGEVYCRIDGVPAAVDFNRKER